MIGKVKHKTGDLKKTERRYEREIETQGHDEEEYKKCEECRDRFMKVMSSQKIEERRNRSEGRKS